MLSCSAAVSGEGSLRRPGLAWPRFPITRNACFCNGRYAGEGFDDARLTLLSYVTRLWQGRSRNMAGCLHRVHDGKREVRVYHYADLDVPMLSRMFHRRLVERRSRGGHDPAPGQRHTRLADERIASRRSPMDQLNIRSHPTASSLLLHPTDPPLRNPFVHVASTPSLEPGGP